METTIGKLLIQGTLPDGIHMPQVLDKSGFSKLLKDVGEKHPENYGEFVKNIRDAGNHIAFQSGSSFSLEDLRPLTGIRDKVFKEHQAEERAIRKELSLNPELIKSTAYQQRKIKLLSKIEDKVNTAIASVIKDAPNNLTSWIASGARGDTAMGRQMLGMAGLNLDATNKLVPEVSKRSFSEGLSPVDFLIHAQGARRGLVNTYTAVRDPGAFAKELNTINMDMVVTASDCGTMRHRSLRAGDPDIIDRCLAENVVGIGSRNDTITPSMYEAFKKKGGVVPVRSPLTCESEHGVCSKCSGLNEAGRLPAIGEHVGLKAAQALTEPLTQLALNQKHTGGVIGAGKSPLQQILQVMHAPKVFVGAATLAKRSGAVDKVEAGASGGWHVHVAGNAHFVQPGFDLLVRRGDVVEAGDALSTGQLNPTEVVAYKGMRLGREHFADTLKNMYADSGIRGSGRVFETVARGILNLGQVVQPGSTGHVPGEMVHWNNIQKHIPETHDSVHIDNGLGKILAKETAGILPYTTLTSTTLNRLRVAGVTQVPVYKSTDLVVRPVMLGTERAALHKSDWLANLAFRFVTKTFKDNVATGASSQIANTWNPVSSFVYGKEFGKGTGGKY